METRCTDAPETPDRRRAPRAFSTSRRGRKASPMTCRAARELLNLVFRDQPRPELELVGWRVVVHAKDRLARPDVLLGMAVAVEAPLHLQRFFLPHQRHAIYLPVARGAPDALVQMDAVVEVHEIGQVVDARPANR